MSIIENLQASDLSSLKIGNGEVRYLKINDAEELGALHELYKQSENIHITGMGTNSVYGDYSGIVAYIGINGFTLTDNILNISAGESWQKAVDISVKNNLHGIERLTSIPGTVGASPIQNIGAFGQLLSDRLVSVSVYNYKNDQFFDVSASDCGFGAHRQSNFKSLEDWQSFVVTGITISLLDTAAYTDPNGDGLLEFVKQKGFELGSVSNTEVAIRNFRTALYPDYITTPNCGSYFTNFEIYNSEIESLNPAIMNIKHRSTSNGARTLFQCKDLLHSVGIDSGFVFSENLRMHATHNNILTNHTGNASLDELLVCHNYVNRLLQEKYGIMLIPEADFVDDTRDRWVK